MKIIIPPHLKVGVRVDMMESGINIIPGDSDLLKDIRQIVSDIESGKYFFPGSKLDVCFAIAHPQISDRPMRYFVLNPKYDKLIKAYGATAIINPRLVSKDRMSRVMFAENCMSYPFRPAKKCKRFKKIVVDYVSINHATGEYHRVTNKELTDLPAIIFQHELEHLNGKSIYTK